MAAATWSYVTLFGLLSLAFCSAHRVLPILLNTYETEDARLDGRLLEGMTFREEPKLFHHVRHDGCSATNGDEGVSTECNSGAAPVNSGGYGYGSGSGSGSGSDGGGGVGCGGQNPGDGEGPSAGGGSGRGGTGGRASSGGQQLGNGAEPGTGGGYGYGSGSGGNIGNGGGGGGSWSSGGQQPGYGTNPGAGSGYGYGSGSGGNVGSGGGGGGGWSSGGQPTYGGPGYGGSSGGGGYGWGSGYGSGGDGGFDLPYFPGIPGLIPGFGTPYHCQPSNCPPGSPCQHNFVLYIDNGHTKQSTDKIKEKTGMEDDRKMEIKEQDRQSDNMIEAMAPESS